MKTELGAVYAVPASHGEGRFVADKELIEELFETVRLPCNMDLEGSPTMDEAYNPNGSYYAIESIISPNGRVLGKMAHPERNGDSVVLISMAIRAIIYSSRESHIINNHMLIRPLDNGESM